MLSGQALGFNIRLRYRLTDTQGRFLTNRNSRQVFPGYSSRCLGCHEFTLQLPQGPSMQSKIRCAVRVQPCDPETSRSISRFPVFLSNYGGVMAGELEI